MSNVANLTGAMRFVVGIAVKVSDNLNAKDQYRQDQRYGEQTQREALGHHSQAIVAKHISCMQASSRSGVHRADNLVIFSWIFLASGACGYTCKYSL